MEPFAARVVLLVVHPQWVPKMSEEHETSVTQTGATSNMKPVVSNSEVFFVYFVLGTACKPYEKNSERVVVILEAEALEKHQQRRSYSEYFGMVNQNIMDSWAIPQVCTGAAEPTGGNAKSTQTTQGELRWQTKQGRHDIQNV